MHANLILAMVRVFGSRDDKGEFRGKTVFIFILFFKDNFSCQYKLSCLKVFKNNKVRVSDAAR